MKKLTDALGADLHVKRFLLGNRRFALWQKIDGGEGSTQAATHPDDRRTRDRDRRCGTDHRPEVEQFLQGEGRSRIDRRRVTKHRYRPFKKARAYVHSLGFKSRGEWDAYCASAAMPHDIPVAPQYSYASDWLGWHDWLGPTCG